MFGKNEMSFYGGYMRINPKMDLGNMAQIFVNGADGYLYSDTALRAINDNCMDEILDVPSMIIFAKNDQIPIKCGIWIENNEWYPIIRFSPDQKFCLIDGDWIFEEKLKGEPDEIEYIHNQLKSCMMLADIIENTTVMSF